MTLPIPITGDTIYHEAGHTAMFVYYDIPIQHVSIRPDFANRYGGMVVLAQDPPQSGKEALENWMRCSAAGDAAKIRGYNLPTVGDKELIENLERAKAIVSDDPDNPGHNDMQNFATLGLKRDREAGVEQAGPLGWIPILRDAERLINGEIWPAVEAVFQRLWAIAEESVGRPVEEMPNLDGEEAAAIVRAALR